MDGVSGTLVDTMDDVATAAGAILADDDLRSAMSAAATEVAQRFKWEETASVAFGVLAEEARRTRERRGS